MQEASGLTLSKHPEKNRGEREGFSSNRTGIRQFPWQQADVANLQGFQHLQDMQKEKALLQVLLCSQPHLKLFFLAG